MKRYKLEFADGKKCKLYANDLDNLKHQFPEATKITQIYDLSHEKYCKLLLENVGAKIAPINKGESLIYHIYVTLRYGSIQIKLFQDNFDTVFYDYCEYKFQPLSKLVETVGWCLSTPKQVWDKFFQDSEITYKLVGFYKAGTNMPKLKKPKELSGVKGSSVTFIPKKFKFQYFVKDNDLYIKANDFFSPVFVPENEDFDKPLSYIVKKYFGLKKSEKFIYPDCWGSVVIRQMAWLKFENIIKVAPLMNYISLTNLAMGLMKEKHKLSSKFIECYEWTHMFENLFKQIKFGVNK